MVVSLQSQEPLLFIMENSGASFQHYLTVAQSSQGFPMVFMRVQAGTVFSRIPFCDTNSFATGAPLARILDDHLEAH